MAPQQTPAPLPGRAYYGFVLYVSAWTCILCYLTWALVPHEYLHELGITYLPHKFWAIALPSVIVMGVVLFITLIYPGINLLLAVPPHDTRTLQDSHTLRRDLYESVPPTDRKNQARQQYRSNGGLVDASSNSDVNHCVVQHEVCDDPGASSAFNELSESEDTSGVPPVYDLHISDVCRTLYGDE